MWRGTAIGWIVVLLALVWVSPAHAQATASTLIPVTAPEFLPQSDPPAVGADNSGRVMIVYLGKGPDAKWKLYSLLRQGSTWQQQPVPTPDVGGYPAELAPRQIVGGAPAGGFHLIATYYSKLYYWHWQGGAWSAPELVTDKGAAGVGIALDASGQPLIARSSSRFRFYRKAAGQWQETQLAPELWQKTVPSITTGPRGVPHLLGVWANVPVVATLRAGKDPQVEANWIVTPSGDRTAWTGGVPRTATYAQFGLDWVHQLVYGAWAEQKSSPPERRYQVRWGPVGVTAEGQWQSATVELPERASMPSDSFRLMTNGYGHAALGHLYSLGGDPSLHFRWLRSTGPAADVELVRPATQTEACVFSTLSAGSLSLCVDQAGTAHVVVRGVKRGEVPANQERLFYASVTGGGTASTEEPGGATGGGTGGSAGGTTEGPRPDFVVAFSRPLAAANVRIAYDSVTPVVTVTNQGAQYFGDLWLTATLDGAQVRVHVPDPSGHRVPLFDRGQTKTYYLPKLDLEKNWDPAYPPAPATYEYPVGTAHLHPATGLGRKLLSVTVDPDNQINEAAEDNNVGQVEYLVYDGRNPADHEKGPDGKTIDGLNDLNVAQPPQLKSNTPLWRAGYMQRPTHLQVAVGNPRLASFFAGTTVAVSLDGQEIVRNTVDQLNNVPNLWSGALTPTTVFSGTTPKPDLSGAVPLFPVDLTQVAEGTHKLTVVVDPEDRFADRHRENNTAEVSFKVRGPGGTLRVRVVDKDDGTTPISGAVVSLRDLWAQLTDAIGVLEIPDVPPGAYNGKALSADRTGSDPRYYPTFASPFAITAGQTTTVTVPLEKAVVIVGDVYDTSTNALLTTETVGVALRDQDFYHPTYVTGPRYQILDVPPGPQTVQAGAYSFRDAQVAQDVHRGAQGQCRVDLRLQPGPRAVVEGTVVDEATSRPIAGADVWLNGAPRFAVTDAQGHYRLEKVAANADYQVQATAASYTVESTTTGVLADGQTRQLPPLKLAKIVSHLTSLDFHAITWADFEQTSTGKGSFAVRVKYGQFDASLALMCHTLTGRPAVGVDQLLLGATPGPWCESRVSTYRAPGIICVALVEAKEGANNVYNGNLLALGQRIKTVYDYATGNFDPAQLSSSGTVVGTFTSQSENSYSPEVSIFGLPVSEGLWGFTATDGTTTVRVDKIEVTDDTTTKTVSRQWYSPSLGVYQIGQTFDPDKLEVRVYLQVMNQNLSVGPLYASSRNVITWKPMQDKWARMDPRPY